MAIGPRGQDAAGGAGSVADSPRAGACVDPARHWWTLGDVAPVDGRHTVIRTPVTRACESRPVAKRSITSRRIAWPAFHTSSAVQRSCCSAVDGQRTFSAATASIGRGGSYYST